MTFKWGADDMNDKDIRAVLELSRKMAEMQKQISRMMNPLVETLDILKKSSKVISKAAVEKLKEADAFLRKQENQLWCIDVNFYDAIQDGKVRHYADYIDSQLDEYIQEMTNDPIYELHATLINETYEAYRAGYYKLCTFPLFSAFEHVIALWSERKITKEKITVNEKPKERKLYKRIQELINEKHAQEGVIKVFAQSVLRIYIKTFVRIPEHLNQELNRNSIAHGYHDYDSITQRDVLKLFQLLKSAMIMKYISPVDFNN